VKSAVTSRLNPSLRQCGADGNAIIPSYPSLAGQQADYLYLQLKSFSQGWRTNLVMQAQIAALSDQDFHNLASYYASLPRHASVTAKAEAAGAAGTNRISRGSA
jgi:cytochrome c553